MKRFGLFVTISLLLTSCSSQKVKESNRVPSSANKSCLLVTHPEFINLLEIRSLKKSFEEKLSSHNFRLMSANDDKTGVDLQWAAHVNKSFSLHFYRDWGAEAELRQGRILFWTENAYLSFKESYYIQIGTIKSKYKVGDMAPAIFRSGYSFDREKLYGTSSAHKEFLWDYKLPFPLYSIKKKSRESLKPAWTSERPYNLQSLYNSFLKKGNKKPYTDWFMKTSINVGPFPLALAGSRVAYSRELFESHLQTLVPRTDSEPRVLKELLENLELPTCN